MDIEQYEANDNKLTLDKFLFFHKNIPNLYDNICIKALNYTSTSVCWKNTTSSQSERILFITQKPTVQNENGESTLNKLFLQPLKVINNTLEYLPLIDLQSDGDIKKIISLNDNTHCLVSNKNIVSLNNISIENEINKIDLNDKSNDSTDYFTFDCIDGKFAIGGSNGQIKLIDSTSHQLDKIDSHRNVINEIKYHSIPNLLLTCSHDRYINM